LLSGEEKIGQALPGDREKAGVIPLLLCFLAIFAYNGKKKTTGEDDERK
jgi:hypothetical protein